MLCSLIAVHGHYTIITSMFVLGRGLIRAGENNVGESVITFVILGAV
jgi:hypothetical protein